MSYWADLVAAALVGTARVPSLPRPTSGTTADTLLSQLSAQTPERHLLASAAVLDTWERAGIQPLSTSTPRPAPAPPDVRPQCSTTAVQHLARILQGDMGILLEEWLEALAASGHGLPHRWLPEILDLACQKRDVQPFVLPLLGERGRWLAAQHEVWQKLLVPLDPEAMTTAWETGSHQARLALLQHLRTTNPPAAHDLLSATWSAEAAKERATFVGALAEGLSLADEPFLENALDDRSKQVREAAASLLARLAGSTLVERMCGRLQPLLRVERRLLGQSLTIALPEVFDEGMARDGIESKPVGGIGERAWWLLQMLAAVPPATWSQSWKKSPTEIIALAGKSEHGPVLLEGWTRGALHHCDGQWMEALLHRWAGDAWSIVPAKTLSVFVDKPTDLLQVVPLARLESWLTDLVNANRRTLAENDLLLNLLSAHRRPWGKPLATVVLQGMRTLAGSQKSDPIVWRWRSALPDFARIMPPDLAGEAEKGWPSESTWGEAIDRFLAILRFRQCFLQSLR